LLKARPTEGLRGAPTVEQSEPHIDAEVDIAAVMIQAFR
jgi:hypothetical protein